MPDYAYFQGKFMPLSQAKMGILTHAFHYGTACFEGIRGNWNKQRRQLYLFRVREHYLRLMDGCRILKMNLPYTLDQYVDLTVETVKRSGLKNDVYVRPVAYKSSQSIGVKLHGLDDDFFIIASTLSSYLDCEKGVRCCTSSWRRVDDTMIPARGKITGIYVNSALAKTEANENGFDEAIMLNHDGHVSEGSGENIFMYIDGKLAVINFYSRLLLQHPGILNFDVGSGVHFTRLQCRNPRLLFRNNTIGNRFNRSRSGAAGVRFNIPVTREKA